MKNHNITLKNLEAKIKAKHWFNDYQNIIELGRLLIEAGKFYTVDDLQEYYEKPWHWSDEWEYFKDNNAGVSDSVRNNIINKIKG